LGKLTARAEDERRDEGREFLALCEISSATAGGENFTGASSGTSETTASAIGAPLHRKVLKARSAAVTRAKVNAMASSAR